MPTAQTNTEQRPTGGRQIRELTVAAVEQLSPCFRRITFTGEDLATLEAPLPAQWLKVAVPDAARQRPENRAYTVRRLDARLGRLDIDFVLHGDVGPLSAWVARVKIGDRAQVGGLRGGFRIEPAARWRLLAGDETALPAICAILEHLPAEDCPVRVVVETPSLADVQALRGSPNLTIEWLARDDAAAAHGSMLVERLSRLDIPTQGGQVFAAGETAAIRSIRKDLAIRAPEAVIDAMGYWRLGQADHREQD